MMPLRGKEMPYENAERDKHVGLISDGFVFTSGYRPTAPEERYLCTKKAYQLPVLRRSDTSSLPDTKHGIFISKTAPRSIPLSG
ncbi:MAG: hypothetical protein ACNA78_12025, partial [Balneolaceae bacterium]